MHILHLEGPLMSSMLKNSAPTNEILSSPTLSVIEVIQKDGVS